MTAPSWNNNGYITVKIQGGFHEIRSSICDVVAVSRLLNATLVIPELQGTTSTKGISSKFKSFGYLYNEDQFIVALANDVLVVKSLPKRFKVARKNKEIPVFMPAYLSSPNFYLEKVLPKLKKQMVVDLLVSGGGCLQCQVDYADSVHKEKSFRLLNDGSRGQGSCLAGTMCYMPAFYFLHNYGLLARTLLHSFLNVSCWGQIHSIVEEDAASLGSTARIALALAVICITKTSKSLVKSSSNSICSNVLSLLQNLIFLLQM
eukprot:Gb_02581 [translate_table: standard]